MRRYFDTVIFCLGIFLLIFGGYLVWERRTPLHVASAQATNSASHLPSLIEIPVLGLRLPVLPSRLIDNNWETSKEGVSYFLGSPLPGKQGNSVMYGHNWPNLLGGLNKIKPGDEIRITSGTQEYIYLVHYITEITPDQAHIYSATTDYRLTLYTCSGFLDSKRLVVTAILK